MAPEAATPAAQTLREKLAAGDRVPFTLISGAADGVVGGDIPKLPTNLVLLKSCQVVGVFYGAFSGLFPKENQQNFAEIMALFEQGKIDPLIGAEFALTEYAAALNCLAERRAVGKVVVNL